MRIRLLTIVLTIAVSIGALAQQPPPAVGVKQFNDGTNWIVLDSTLAFAAIVLTARAKSAGR